MNEQVVVHVGRALQTAGSVLVVSHVRPDGDAVGSTLGLGLALKSAGKQVQMVLSDGVPSKLRFLQDSELIERRVEGRPDLVVALDASDLGRLGNGIDNLGQPDINIDHHVTNENYARLNLVDTQAAATAEILAQNFGIWGLRLEPLVAEALLTGIVTDTIGFKTPSVTTNTMQLASRLMEAGANLPELYRQALDMRSYQALQFWGHGLNRLERENGLVWTTLTMEDRRDIGYPGRDDADLINILASIEDANISIIFVEQGNDSVKVSWRARPGFDVSSIATSFGGGGHQAAAGAEIVGSLEDVRYRVINTTKAKMKLSERT